MRAHRARTARGVVGQVRASRRAAGQVLAARPGRHTARLRDAARPAPPCGPPYPLIDSARPANHGRSEVVA
jgi:hypothetical protein